MTVFGHSISSEFVVLDISNDRLRG